MIKKELCLIIILLIIPSISAQNITVSYPEKIEIGNEFLFNIKLIDFAEDTYDVKIDILESGDRVARILNNGEWKSTYYYVVDIIKQDEEKEFSLNITEYIGNSNIEIRIRDSNGDSKKFDNYEIESFAGEVEEIIETESTEIIEELNETSEDVLSNEIKEEILELPEKNTSKKITGLSIEENAKESEINIIKLNPKDIKTEEIKEDLGIEDYAMYGFVFFCILLVILFILKKNKSDKNEFN